MRRFRPRLAFDCVDGAVETKKFHTQYRIAYADYPKLERILETWLKLEERQVVTRVGFSIVG